MTDTIIIGCDHAGYAAKEQAKDYLQSLGLAVEDVGCFSPERVDYPRYGQLVAAAVAEGRFPRGLLICGTGIGMSIVANKYPRIRAALCHNAYTAVASREHNDANILVMGARVLDWPQMREIIDLFLATPFAAGRHSQRLAMIP